MWVRRACCLYTVPVVPCPAIQGSTEQEAKPPSAAAGAEYLGDLCVSASSVPGSGVEMPGVIRVLRIVRCAAQPSFSPAGASRRCWESGCVNSGVGLCSGACTTFDVCVGLYFKRQLKICDCGPGDRTSDLASTRDTTREFSPIILFLVVPPYCCAV